jgi:hypothetical protein
VECLRKLHAFKGSRNALKRLDYDTVKFLRVDFLPLVFTGDIEFELLPLGSSAGNLQAKLMMEMDKKHNGHAWTKTIILHIKNDIGLTFCTSSCVRNLLCNNQDCKYLNHVLCTSPKNETKWDGSTLTSFLAKC